MKIKDKPDVASRLYSFDFKNRLRPSETLTSGNAAVRSGTATVSSISVSGTKLFVRISGGAIGEDCEIMLSATTSQSDTVAEPLFFSVVG